MCQATRLLNRRLSKKYNTIRVIFLPYIYPLPFKNRGLLRHIKSTPSTWVLRTKFFHIFLMCVCVCVCGGGGGGVAYN